MSPRAPYLRLVAPLLSGQNRAVATTQPLGARAHWALHCLPRDERGRLPTVRDVERSQGLTNARLQKVLSGETKSPTTETLRALAKALGCPFEWLAFGEGESPKTSYNIPPWNPEAYKSGKKRARRVVVKLPSKAPSGTNG